MKLKTTTDVVLFVLGAGVTSIGLGMLNPAYGVISIGVYLVVLAIAEDDLGEEKENE